MYLISASDAHPTRTGSQFPAARARGTLNLVSATCRRVQVRRLVRRGYPLGLLGLGLRSELQLNGHVTLVAAEHSSASLRDPPEQDLAAPHESGRSAVRRQRHG